MPEIQRHQVYIRHKQECRLFKIRQETMRPVKNQKSAHFKEYPPTSVQAQRLTRIPWPFNATTNTGKQQDIKASVYHLAVCRIATAGSNHD